MNRIVSRGLVAVFAGAMLTSAQAVPIHLEFTGTTVDGTTPVSGALALESDRFVPVPGFAGVHVDWQPTGLADPLASVSVGGREVTIPRYETNYVHITFTDVCNPVCAPNTLGDTFGVGAFSEQPWNSDFTGTRNSVFLTLAFIPPVPLPDDPYWQPLDLFDAADVTPLSVATLPTHYVLGLLGESTWECVSGSCTESSAVTTAFNLDSLTRSVGARSVPEPGTLGLLVLGFGMALVTRRRRRIALS